ncbi:sulfatase [Robinsoniella peoriensis]|uniref:sulfatase n=1 Tax=Robinsoniella peoriensis TaxID=180332 RepID=UPI0005C7BD04|nr:sulfatase [Robinsoniella peoriensis]
MKAIMVMYDTLNRLMLEPYGCDWIKTSNFCRLAEHAATFDGNYVGSLPCMPARRELHTGRYNFEHRSWGPIEPFDDSMPEILKNHGIYTHLSTDHNHYWQDGGATYHTRYNSYSFSRGQEGDEWKVNKELLHAFHDNKMPGPVNYHDLANREYIDCEEKMPQAVTFADGLEFIDKLHDADNWFLQIETFDPHEPFFTQAEYRELYPDGYEGSLTDWPPYYMVTEGEDAVIHMRNQYAALVTMCDRYLGKVLDRMDEYNLWEDTMLIVNTDHGFLLGEHGWWAKSVMPPYEEISHTPMFLYDPGNKIAGERRSQLTQTIDIPATLLEFFGVEIPKDMQGKPLRKVVEQNEVIHEYAFFGFHEGHLNVTDGDWVYMKAPVSREPYYEYTLMPTHMTNRFQVNELQDIELQEPFSLTKGCKTMKIQRKEHIVNNDHANYGTKLFYLPDDPKQEHNLVDPEQETILINALLDMMHHDDCPTERYKRYGLPSEGNVEEEYAAQLREQEDKERIPQSLADLSWKKGAVNIYHTIAKIMPEEAMMAAADIIKRNCAGNEVSVSDMFKVIDVMIPEENRPVIQYFAALASRTF